MKTQLKVSPLLDYTLPVYPTYADRSPLHPPKKQWSTTNYYKVALLGVLGLFGCDLASGNKNGNPIKFVDLGFPYQTSVFGTGMPQRFDRATAVAIIDSVFQANELTLEKDHTISGDRLLFKATGYDPTVGIGYVWVDWKNITGDFCTGCKTEKVPTKLPEDFDEQTISMDEMKKVIESEEQKVAVFSMYQARLSYYSEYALTKSKELERFENFASRFGYDLGHSQTKAQAIERLEKFVQDYIDWAKSEGRF